MQLTDLLAQMGGLKSMARELGVSEPQVASGAEALLPAILGGFKKQAQAQPTGLEGLGGLLGRLGGGGLLDEVLAPQPTNVNHGNDVLAQIFGSKDVSRTVAQDAATRSGLDPAVLKKMLPLLAMLVAGFMSRSGGAGAQAAPGGGLADVLGSMLGGGRNAGADGATAGGGLGGLLGGLLGAGAAGAAGGAGAPQGGGGLGSLGGWASMLDLDGNGNPLDDIVRMAGKAMR